MNEKSKVTAIVLTYNSLSKLGESFFYTVLSSLLSQDYENLEVLIVDNGSIDGTREYVEKLCRMQRNCRTLFLRRNYGWSGGNNRGAVLAKSSEFLFFMNDDVVLEPSCIRRLVEVLDKAKDIAAVQPLIRNADGTINCGLDVGFSGLPKMVHYLKGYPLSETFYVSGCAMLTRREVFNRVGMFDDDLFLYHDDADYSWRLRLSGYRVACVADTKAYHYGSATLGADSSTYLYFLMRNNIWVLAKNSTLPYFFLRLTLFFLEVFISFIGHYLLVRRDLKKVNAILRGLIDGIRNLRIPFSKRREIAKIKKISENKINKAMNHLIDIDLLLFKSLRKRLGLNL